MANSQRQHATDSTVSSGTAAEVHWVAFDVHHSDGRHTRHTRYFSGDEIAERDALIERAGLAHSARLTD